MFPTDETTFWENVEISFICINIQLFWEIRFAFVIEKRPRLSNNASNVMVIPFYV